MSDPILIQVLDTKATITNNEDKTVGNFEIVQLNTNFSVGAIPTCTVMLATGSTFNNTINTSDTTIALMNEYMDGGLSIRIDFTLNINGSRKPVCVFKGKITSVNLTQNIAAYGNSTSAVVVTAYHRFVDLHEFGANGMIYAASNDIQYRSQWLALKDAQESKKAVDRYATSTNMLNIQLIDNVLKDTCPIPGSSDTRTYKPVVQILDKLISEMDKHGIIVPTGYNVDLKQYIDGSVTPSKNIKYAYNLVRSCLVKVWNSVSNSSIGAAVLSILTSADDFLTIAPRSVDKLTIIPDNGVDLNEEHPVITRDRYSAIAYDSPIGPTPEPEGVLITASGSDTFKGGKAVVSGKYTKASPNRPIRWFTTMAPSWVVEYNPSYSSGAKKGNQQSNVDNIEERCNQYARWLYNKIIRRKNVCVLSSDIRSIEAFSALGTVCRINTDIYGDIQGMFYAYALSYTQSAKASHVDIKLHFTHTQKYSNILTSDLVSFYTVDDSDIVKEFPDITK